MPTVLFAPSPPATLEPVSFRVTPSRGRRLWPDALFWSLALVFLLLRVSYGFLQRVNSDEPQHLHVAWGWTQGLLPYRDFFDNHSPLFGWLCAPLLRLVGERADVIPWMRLAMVPLTLLGLGCVYRISRALYPPRVARWAALLAGLYPSFFFVGTEFRTDALWCLLWLAAVATLVGGPATPRRALAVGLLLGAALGVSLKTVMMLGALGLALTGTLALRGFVAGAPPWRRLRLSLAAGLAGLVLIPGLIAAFFAAHGAWEPLLACTVSHNHPVAGSVGMAGAPGHVLLRHLLFPVALVGMGPVALMLLCSDPHRGSRRALVFLTTGIYGALLLCFWPALTRQSFLPLYPLAAVLAVAAGGSAIRWLSRAPRWAALASECVFGAVAIAEIVLILTVEPPWINHAVGSVRQIGTVLRLTDPGEFVMDAKGAAVFRPRPVFPVLETFTMRQFRQGLRPDDIVERLVATNTAVVIPAGLTERTEAFVNANYLPVGGGVGVAGKGLSEPGSDGEIRFAVSLPARYVLLSCRGIPLPGRWDEEADEGQGQPRFLAAGPHRFRPREAAMDGPPVLLWAQASARGVQPVASWSVKNPSFEGRAGE